jgi:hypothetical protein
MGDDLARQLDEWVEHDLISRAQADAIRRHELATSDRRRGTPLIAEVLGYLGGALVLIAAITVVTQFWEDFAVAGRLAITAVGAVAVLAAGGLLVGRPEPALRRLGGFLWLLAVAATAFWMAVLTRDALDWDTDAAATASAVVSLAVAGFLWRLRPRALQQIAVFVAAIAAVVTTLELTEVDDETTVGLAVFALGVVWLVVGWRGLVPPRRTAEVLGCIGMLVGVQAAVDDPWAMALGVVVGVALLGVAVVADDAILLGFGVAGVFLFVPQLVFEWFADTLGTPITLLVCGLVLLGVAAIVARLRATDVAP